MINICIGYDPKESIAFHVLAHSIMRRASGPISITPIYLPALEAEGMYTRTRDPNQSTDFTFSRFLTPWISSTRFAESIFMDCDMLCLADIYEVINLCQTNKDVSVVQHDYVPCPDPKFLGQTQTTYPCKNWSSFMVFHGHRMATRHLTPSYVNSATPMDLHQFKWVRPDGLGNLPVAWNHLVGEYPPNPNAKIVHFTRGGPWFPEYADCEYANEWREECDSAMSVKKG